MKVSAEAKESFCNTEAFQWCVQQSCWMDFNGGLGEDVEEADPKLLDYLFPVHVCTSAHKHMSVHHSCTELSQS